MNIILSPRELEVASLLTQGLTNKEIAAELHLSPETVRTQVQWAKAKLRVHSRVEVAVWFVKQQMGDVNAISR